MPPSSANRVRSRREGQSSAHLGWDTPLITWHGHGSRSTRPCSTPALFAQGQGHRSSRADVTDLVQRFPACLERSCMGKGVLWGLYQIKPPVVHTEALGSFLAGKVR